MTERAINIVLSEPPGHDSQFVEIETDDGLSVDIGEWIDRGDGTWALRITTGDVRAVTS